MRMHVRNLAGGDLLERSELAKLVADCAPPAWPDDAEVGVVFVTDAKIARLNEQYLSREGPTDVIAFPLEDTCGAGNDNTVGEVVVSVDTARREAAQRGVELREELALYVVHGLLHLAGYDDASAAGRRRMYAKERDILERNGYAHAR